MKGEQIPRVHEGEGVVQFSGMMGLHYPTTVASL